MSARRRKRPHAAKGRNQAKTGKKASGFALPISALKRRGLPRSPVIFGVRVRARIQQQLSHPGMLVVVRGKVQMRLVRVARTVTSAPACKTLVRTLQRPLALPGPACWSLVSKPRSRMKPDAPRPAITRGGWPFHFSIHFSWTYSAPP